MGFPVSNNNVNRPHNRQSPSNNISRQTHNLSNGNMKNISSVGMNSSMSLNSHNPHNQYNKENISPCGNGAPQTFQYFPNHNNSQPYTQITPSVRQVQSQQMQPQRVPFQQVQPQQIQPQRVPFQQMQPQQIQPQRVPFQQVQPQQIQPQRVPFQQVQPQHIQPQRVPFQQVQFQQIQSQRVPFQQVQPQQVQFQQMQSQQVQFQQVEPQQVQHVFDSQNRMWHEATLIDNSFYDSNTNNYYQLFRLNQLILDPASQQYYYKTVLTEVIFNPATQQKYNSIVSPQLYANQDYTPKQGVAGNTIPNYSVNNNAYSMSSNSQGHENQVTAPVVTNIPDKRTIPNYQISNQTATKQNFNSTANNSDKSQLNQTRSVSKSQKSNRLDQFDSNNSHFVMSGPAELMNSLHTSFTKSGVSVVEKKNAQNNVITITTRYNDNKNRQIKNIEPGSPRTHTPRVLIDHHSREKMARTYKIYMAYGDANNISFTEIVNGDTALAAKAYANLPKAHLAIYSTQTIGEGDIDQLPIAIGEVKDSQQIIRKEQSFTLKPGVGTSEKRAVTQNEVMGGSATSVARKNLGANINSPAITPQSQQCLKMVIDNTDFQWRHLKPFSEFGNASQAPDNLTAGTSATNAIDNIFEIALKELVNEIKMPLMISLEEICIKNPAKPSLRADVSIGRDTIVLNPANKRFCIMNYNAFATSKPPHKTIMAAKELLRLILF